MRISIAGAGYVGLVTAVCLADKGHNVTCVDVDEAKINMLKSGKSPIYEQGLEELMIRNSERIRYTSDYSLAYKDTELIIIGVGTPEKKDGSANLSYIYTVANQIAETVDRNCIVAVKSTVPVGTNDKVEKLINEKKVNEVLIEVVSNPEFLAQGTAVKDTLYPNRIVIGAESRWAEATMMKVYHEFDAPILVTDRKSAEMIKYASNDFLALKVSYINEIANLCEIVGANVEDVARGMGYDSRIGDQFLNAGIGYGGSCFPKDTKALHWLANMNDYELKTVKAAIEVNEQQKLKLLKKASKYYSSFCDLTVAILGLTFKPGTDDLRESPSLVNIPYLLEDGAKVKVFDPVGIDNLKRIYNGDIQYCKSVDHTILGADICFIFTDWNEIKNYEVERFAKLMRTPIVMDGRNCFDLERLKAAGITYESIGRR